MSGLQVLLVCLLGFYYCFIFITFYFLFVFAYYDNVVADWLVAASELVTSGFKFGPSKMENTWHGLTGG